MAAWEKEQVRHLHHPGFFYKGGNIPNINTKHLDEVEMCTIYVSIQYRDSQLGQTIKIFSKRHNEI
jgi:hypothetical protein